MTMYRLDSGSTSAGTFIRAKMGLLKKKMIRLIAPLTTRLVKKATE